MLNSGEITTISGNYYKIEALSEINLSIIDEQGDIHSYDLDKESKSYYKRWFYNLCEDRKEKINKINKNLKSD
jgi:hypothetical protein